MIDTRLIGPKDDQYAVLSLGTVWLATTKAPYAEAVSAAIAAAIAGGGAADAAPPAIVAHSKTEYKRLKEQGANVLPPSATAATGKKEKLLVRLQAALNDCINENWQVHEETIEDAIKALSVEEGAPDWAQQLPGAEMFDRAARYEYVRKLSPRQFAALFDEALHGHRFDDLVDRYRDASQPSPTTREQPK